MRILLLLPVLLLAGCASFGWSPSVKPIEVQTKAVERTRLNLADPAPLQGRELTWIVITPENAEEVWKRLKEENTDLVLFAITDDGYEQLALTMAELRNFIASQRAIIVKYKEYYEPTKTPDSK
jgi:hypothetical protein